MAVKLTGQIVYYIDGEGNLCSAQSFIDDEGRTDTKESVIEEAVVEQESSN